MERAAGIAHGAQNSRAHVVDHKPQDSGEIDIQVRRGLGKHVIGRFHEAQHVGRHPKSQRRKQNAQDQRHGDGGMDAFADLVLALGAVELGDHHAGAAGQTGKKADEHVHNRPYGTNSRKGLIADIVAYHPGIHRIVKLLENIACQQRQGKPDQMHGNRPLGHVHIAAGPFSVRQKITSFLNRAWSGLHG